MGESAMDLAYRHGWKPRGDRPRLYRWEHPTHGTLRGSGPSSVEPPWRWWAGDDPEREFGSMKEALIEIHGLEADDD